MKVELPSNMGRFHPNAKKASRKGAKFRKDTKALRLREFLRLFVKSFIQ